MSTLGKTFKSIRPGAVHAVYGLCILTAITAATSPATAGSATSWVAQNHAATRLIADTAPWRGREKTLVAGIHIKLDDGWKTYWRNPGDSGLPPRFDWTGSENLKRAEVLWPAPTRYLDSAGTSIGYKKEVVFPVLIEPVKTDEPVDLKLKMEFAVCADICIPAEAEMTLKVGKDGLFSRSYTALLTQYLKRVPIADTPQNKDGPAVRRTVAKLTGNAPHLTIDAKYPDGGAGADLFIEAPDGFYLAAPKPVEKNGDGTVRFKVDLTKGDDPRDLKGKTVKLTLVSSTAQAETSWRID